MKMMTETNGAGLSATNVVITGSTGFLGKAVLREFRARVEAGVLQRVNFILPIRGDPRCGVTGKDRCEKLSKEHGFFYTNTKLCEASDIERGTFPKICVQWIDPTLGVDAWPRETSIVLLCAFDTKFERPLRHMLHSSVRPVVQALRSVAEDIRESQSKRWPHLSQIVLVSTAFVQPPLPYIRRGAEGERVGAWASPNLWGEEPVDKLYNRLVELDDLTLDMAQKISPDLPEQTLHNSYIYCKTLLEALVDFDPLLKAFSEKSNVTISLLRPSIVGASLDGQYFSLKSPGCSVRFLGHIQLVGRAVPWWGSVDLVPVCRVAKAIVMAAGIENVSSSDADINWPVTVGDGRAKIRYCTNGLSYNLVVLSKTCDKWFAYLFSKKMLPVVQFFESLLVSVLFCSLDFGAQLRMYYHLYERFSTCQFDYPTVLGLNIPEILMTPGSSDPSGKVVSASSSNWVHVVMKEEKDIFVKQITNRIKKNKNRIFVFFLVIVYASYLICSLYTTRNHIVMKNLFEENRTFYRDMNNSFMPIWD